MSEEDDELLFFETFSHDNSEDLNLDLVQFPRPVVVTEIRVIPLGTCLNLNLPGNVRLGATNPSSFKLELFVNNLGKPNASTFEKLGVLEYKANVDIQLRTDHRVPTDGLIIKGWYQTITLALYGVLTTVVQDRSSPPPPPPPQLRSKPLAIVPSGIEKPDMVLTQKATLERTQEWAEKAALLIQTTHRSSSAELKESSSHHRSAQPTVEALHSPLSSPTAVNPRDIPLEHRGGTPRDPRDTPRDPRDHSPRFERDDREPGEIYEDRMAAAAALARDERRDSRSSVGEQDMARSRSKDNLVKLGEVPDKDRVERDQKSIAPSFDKDDLNKVKDSERDKKKSSEHLSRDSEKDLDGDNSNRFAVCSKQSDARQSIDMASKSERCSLSPVQSRPPRKSSPDPLIDEDTEPGEIPESNDDIYGSIGHNDDVDKLYNILSDGEIQEGDDNYSQISSDEHFQIDDELPPSVVGIGEELWAEENWKYDTVASFNPYQYDLAPLETFSDPSLTPYELEKQKIILTKDSIMPESAKQILSIIETYRNAPLHDEWIEAMERLPGLLVPGLVYLVNKAENKDALDTLINWTCDGLDLNKAIAQPEAAYKVRHLKMGIRVAGAMCMCDNYVAFQLLSREVQHKLLDLYVSQHMSSSVKLHIINALDQTTRLKEGLDWLLGRHHLQVGTVASTQEVADIMMNDVLTKHDMKDGYVTEKMNCVGQPAMLTGYQRIIGIMLTKQCVRPMVGLTALVRKVHVYEVLLKLMVSLDSLLENLPSVETGIPKVSSATVGVDEVGGESTPAEVDMMDVSRMELDAAAEEDIDVLIQCLDEITKVLSNPDSVFGQPRRILPNHTRFEITKKPQSTFGNLFHMFNACRLLESIFVLLCTPVTCIHAPLFASIKSIFTSLVSTSAGLLYLNCKVETVNGILRALTHADYGQDDDRELNPANQLGLFLIYHLQTLLHIDQLREYRAKESSAGKDVDDAEVLAILHSLYSITFTPQGREAVVTVFTLDENIGVLLPFVELTGEESHDVTIRRSVCYSYAVMLLVLVARHSERVEWLEKFGHKLLSYVEKDTSCGAKVNVTVTELHDWLVPIKTLPQFSSDSDTINELARQLRQYSEEVSDLPKGLVTVLRIMQHLAIAPNSCDESDRIEELKYKYILVEVYGANCLALFATVLQKVQDMLLLPWQQGFPQPVSQKTLLLSVVRPTLAIMKAALSYLILARGSELKDLSCVSCLLHIHTVLCSVSSTGVLPSDIQQIQNDIVDTLMAYTQPCLAKEESEEALSQSLWSMMIKQLLVYTLTAPYTFLSGLILISEMLPIPLPVQTKETLTTSEVTEIINNRKRWSAHFHPHSAEIQKIIHSLAGSLCHPLHQVLRRVCWQLADLAMPTAVTVVRSLLDALMESLDSSCSVTTSLTVDSSGFDQKKDDVPSSSQTARILNLFAFLVNQTQATVKAAFLYLPLSGVKSDEKYGCVLSRLACLLNVVSESPYHIQAQESIVGIFQSFCDMDITLVPPESRLSFIELLANSLPSKDQLALICHSLLEHINNRDQKFSSILPSLRTLTLLMNHDYGFYYVKQAMEQVPTAFFNLFMQINATFSKDSSDCIATLSSAAECIEFLVIIPDPPACVTGEGTGDGGSQSDQPVPAQERSYTMSFSEARNILKWPRNEDIVAHPLNDLDVLLCEYAKDEETLKAVYQSVNAVVGILKSDEETSGRPAVVEPVMPAPLSLTAQFNTRTVYVITDDDDERLNNIYWLSTPMGDESDHEQEMAKVPCDFMEMSSIYCPGFDLKGELEKGSTSPENTLMPKRKRRMGTARRSTDTINTSKMRGANGGFVAPMRGRGFGRGMNAGRGDMFRSRAPNTSRPPSMHVDDYIKLEMQQGQGGSTSTSMPPPSLPPPVGQPRRDDNGHNMFDRCGTRGFPGRGHFYTPPGYSHRDSVGDVVGRGGGGYRGGGVMLPHGGGLPSPRGMLRGTATGVPMMSRGSPSKASPAWGGRNTRQAMYGRPTFVRGDDMQPGGGSMDRLDRPRENMGAGQWYIGGGSPWPDPKDRQPDQRFLTLPPPGAAFNWRDRGRHQRTSTR